jgi:hypothetical protein
VVQYTENPNCMSHDRLERITEISQASSEVTLAGLLKIARADLGEQNVVIEFSREIIRGLECPDCHTLEEVFAPVGKISAQQGKCPRDGHLRAVVPIHGYSGVEVFGSRQLDRLGLPLLDIFTARSSSGEISYLLAGDREQVLGPGASGDSV